MSGHGTVYLIGAGPGDPGLITVRGLECLRRADVIVYDRLANPALLAAGRADAERIYVGKMGGRHALPQEEINRLLVAQAQAGKVVARLKGGDPYLFGRGGEEAEVLVEAGVPFEVVPGVTSAIAAAAYAGIPVTHRDFTSSFTVVTGHEDPTKATSNIPWPELGRGVGTLVFLMGMSQLPTITEQLIRHGRSAATPVALVRWGTWPQQETLVGTLGDIAAKAQAADFGPPAVTVVGEVVRLREKLRWFDNRPLSGRRVLVTRSREQSSDLSNLLRQYGAEPVEFPVIRVVPPADYAEMDAALSRLATYDWVIFTSANGVRAVAERLQALGRDARAFGQTAIAAIGPATAAELNRNGLRPDYVPSEYVAEAIAAGIGEVKGRRVLLPRADIAREALGVELRAQGATVDEVAVYRTLLEAPEGVDVPALLGARRIDVVTFTSSSTVRNFNTLLERATGSGQVASLLNGTVVACIGPVTAETARELGLPVDVVATDYTIPGLVKALVDKLKEQS